jgi:hypothetical protein
MAPQNGNGNGGRPSGRPSFNGMPGRRLGWQNPNNPHYVAPTTATTQAAATTPAATAPAATAPAAQGAPSTAFVPPGLARAAAAIAAARGAAVTPTTPVGGFNPPGNNFGWTRGVGNPHRLAGSFRPPAFGARARFMQGGQRPGGTVPVTTTGVPNALAMGFGQRRW